MAQITVEIPDEYIGCYDKPQYIVLVNAEQRLWGKRPIFSAAVIKDDHTYEEIGEDASIKGLLAYVGSLIWKEQK